MRLGKTRLQTKLDHAGLLILIGISRAIARFLLWHRIVYVLSAVSGWRQVRQRLQTPGFITSKLPILESVFRLFIANGNQPLDLEELGKQLSEQFGGYTHHASAEILSRLLSHDQYYGLRQVAE